MALQYTPLLSSLAHPHYYSVSLEGLWVGGTQLPVAQVRRACSLRCRGMPFRRPGPRAHVGSWLLLMRRQPLHAQLPRVLAWQAVLGYPCRARCHAGTAHRRRSQRAGCPRGLRRDGCGCVAGIHKTASATKAADQRGGGAPVHLPRRRGSRRGMARCWTAGRPSPTCPARRSRCSRRRCPRTRLSTASAPSRGPTPRCVCLGGCLRVPASSGRPKGCMLDCPIARLPFCLAPSHPFHIPHQKLWAAPAPPADGMRAFAFLPRGSCLAAGGERCHARMMWEGALGADGARMAACTRRAVQRHLLRRRAAWRPHGPGQDGARVPRAGAALCAGACCAHPEKPLKHRHPYPVVPSKQVLPAAPDTCRLPFCGCPPHSKL